MTYMSTFAHVPLVISLTVKYLQNTVLVPGFEIPNLVRAKSLLPVNTFHLRQVKALGKSGKMCVRRP